MLKIRFSNLFHSAELGLKYVKTLSLFFYIYHTHFDHFTYKNNRGPWPKKKYARLYRTQGQVLATLALLAGAYSRMSLLTCKRLATKSDLMHPAFVSPKVGFLGFLFPPARLLPKSMALTIFNQNK